MDRDEERAEYLRYLEMGFVCFGVVRSDLLPDSHHRSRDGCRLGSDELGRIRTFCRVFGMSPV